MSNKPTTKTLKENYDRLTYWRAINGKDCPTCRARRGYACIDKRSGTYLAPGRVHIERIDRTLGRTVKCA